MVDFPQYARIKDSFCVCYFGHSDEYLVQLRLLRPTIERHFPGIRLHIGCRDDRAHLLEGSQNVVLQSMLRINRSLYGHVRELKYNGISHPVEDFLDEAGMTDIFLPRKMLPIDTRRCVLVTKGNHPVKPLESHVIGRLKKMAEMDGYSVELDAGIEGAALVVGVESVQIFEAAAREIPTKLYPSGVGTRLYKRMFQSADVMLI